MGYMKIGEFAKRIGVTEQTIRNYEKKGLIHPQRLPSGYRIFTEENVQEILKIEETSTDSLK